MAPSTIGDMRQFFLTTRNNTMLKTELNTLVDELTSGKMSDLTAHLGVSQPNLAGLDRHLELLDRFGKSNQDTSQMLETMQIALGNVAAQRETVSTTLFAINIASNSSQIENAGMVSRSGFETTVNSLNTRLGDRALFGGNDLDSNPLSDASTMLNDISLSIAGVTNVGDVVSAIDDWFNMPGGGFETLGYMSDATGLVSRSIDVNQDIKIGVRADDQSIRDTLKGLALGAVAGDPNNSIDISDRRDMLRLAAENLLVVASPLVELQSGIGYIEGLVEEASVRISSQQSSYGIARNDMINADPFETATRLQAVQLQLETQFTLTARLSRLTLMEYLR